LTLLQAAAASAARVAQLESELERKVVPVAASGDSDVLKKQLLEAEARAKMAEQRAAEAALAAAAAGKVAKEREKAAQDAAAKDMEHLKGPGAIEERRGTQRDGAPCLGAGLFLQLQLQPYSCSSSSSCY
jgi:hypothetical protein